MPNVVELGYLEGEAYLSGPYLTSLVNHGIRSQVQRVIDGANHPIKQQIARQIDATHVVNEQIERLIDNAEHAVNEQIDRLVYATHEILEQIDQRIDDDHFVLSQLDRLISYNKRVASQIYAQINARRSTRSQIDRVVPSDHAVRFEINRGKLLHLQCNGYLTDTDGYLSGPYLAPDEMFCVHAWEQVSRQLTTTKAVRSQIDRQINTNRSVKEQIKRRINATKSIREQVALIAAKRIQSQISQVLYNTNNLRILCDFDSRGVTGTNWTASSTAAGDFSVYNLNTDIVEQRWQSAASVTTGITLVCDTEITQGVFVDTLAILSHNMTTSASVVWQGSNDAGFATIGFTENLSVAAQNIYWIAPVLPQVSYRYHRFLINDNTNTDGHIQIGTILFGAATIFQGECFVDQVTRQTIHFADKIMTEGFTNKSNDRALKFAVSLEFRYLKFDKGNYSKMRDVFETDRTTLKCLWIPTPQYPSRYAVFGKLETIPAERHLDMGNTQDYVSFEVTVNEAL